MPVAAAGILAGTGLLSELLKEKADQEQLRQNRLFSAEQAGYDAQKQGAVGMANADEMALNKLMAAWQKGYGV